LCLFEKFPLENNVFPLININNLNCSCTIIWLTRYARYFNETGFNLDVLDTICNGTTIEDCEFPSKFSRCRFNVSLSETSLNNEVKEWAQILPELYLIDDKYLNFKSNDYLVSIILFPMVCIFGFFFNLINSIVQYKLNKVDKVNDRFFIFLHSILNCLICFIYFFQLGFKCIEPIYNYCALFSITHLFGRYFYIICIAYIGNVLKTCSNLTQILFLFERLIKISHFTGKALKYIAFIKLQKYLCVLLLFLFSAVINTINLFRFQLDITHKYIVFPIFNQIFFNFNYIFSYLNFLYLIINHLLIIFWQFFLNLLILYSSKASITYKSDLVNADKSRNLISNKIQRRSLILILLSGASLLIMHLPDFVLTFYLATLFIYFSDRRLANVYEIGFFEYSSQYYYDLASLLYFLYYLFNFFFFILFDKNFRKQFYRIFFKQKNFE
jgi:hypothetical protein